MVIIPPLGSQSVHLDLRRTRRTARRGRDHDVFGACWTVPTQSAQTVEMRGGLLQRTLELAVLERQLQQIRAGSGRVVFVRGPAGVGKTSLLRAMAQSASGSGVQVLSACAGPLERQAGW